VSNDTFITASQCLYNMSSQELLKDITNITIIFRSKEYKIDVNKVYVDMNDTKNVNERFFSKLTDGEFTPTLYESPYFIHDVAIAKLTTTIPGVNPLNISTTKLKHQSMFYLVTSLYFICSTKAIKIFSFLSQVKLMKWRGFETQILK